jgi:hypothetical protein
MRINRLTASIIGLLASITFGIGPLAVSAAAKAVPPMPTTQPDRPDPAPRLADANWAKRVTLIAPGVTVEAIYGQDGNGRGYVSWWVVSGISGWATHAVVTVNNGGAVYQSPTCPSFAWGDPCSHFLGATKSDAQGVFMYGTLWACTPDWTAFLGNRCLSMPLLPL